MHTPACLFRRPPTSRTTVGREARNVVSVVTSAVAAVVVPTAEAATTTVAPIVTSTADTGVVDVDGDGSADHASYGETNEGLSVGEQGGDGWELRYLAPFSISDAARDAIDAGWRVTLAFRVWRADELDDHQLVVTALPGGRTGTWDFKRGGTEVHRGDPVAGRVAVDVTDALRAIDDSKVTFRFASDIAPVKGDDKQPQINIATAEGRTSERPQLTFADPLAERGAPDATIPEDDGTTEEGPGSIVVVPSTSDAGALDDDGDGVADYGYHGYGDVDLSVGEEGRDGWNLRYVAAFAVQNATREAIEAGHRAELSFLVRRADELDGRKLVVTALPGRQEGTADFDREGIEVHRGAPAEGRMTVDVTDAMRATDSSTVTFRLATDVAPTKGDGRRSVINVATANAEPLDKPALTFIPSTPLAVPTTESEAATTTTTAPKATTTTTAPKVTTTTAPKVTTTTTAPKATTTTTAPKATTTTTAPKATTTTTAPKATTTTTAPKATTTTTAPKAAGSLVWSEEFGGSSLDTRVWKPYHSTYGDGNNELACLTPGNVSVSGGSLKLTARREKLTCPNGSTRQFSSGFLGTRETGTYFPRYGRFEIRAKVPHAQGLWPAFWLRHRNGSGVAEVDVMEYFHSQVPGKTTQTLHLDGRSNVSKRTTFVESPTSSPGGTRGRWRSPRCRVGCGSTSGWTVRWCTPTPTPGLVGLTPARVRGCGTSR